VGAVAEFVSCSLELSLFFSSWFSPLSPAKSLESFSLDVIGSNDKNAIRAFVWLVDYLQITAVQRLSEFDSRFFPSSKIIPAAYQNLADFFLTHSVPKDVGLPKVWIDVKPNFHFILNRGFPAKPFD
jgi:hypothetical protein